MPDPSVLLLATALDADESVQALERLGRVDLPNVAKHVVTVGKFDTRNAASTLNIEAGYPDEPPHLQTLAAWAEQPGPADLRSRDAYDLYCLRKLLATGVEGHVAVILRDDVDLGGIWPDIQKKIEGEAFLLVSPEESGSSIVFNLTDPATLLLLDLAWELHISGAAYAMDPYGIEHVLTAASDALRLRAAI